MSLYSLTKSLWGIFFKQISGIISCRSHCLLFSKDSAAAGLQFHLTVCKILKKLYIWNEADFHCKHAGFRHGQGQNLIFQCWVHADWILRPFSRNCPKCNLYLLYQLLLKRCVGELLNIHCIFGFCHTWGIVTSVIKLPIAWKDAGAILGRSLCNLGPIELYC